MSFIDKIFGKQVPANIPPNAMVNNQPAPNPTNNPAQNPPPAGTHQSAQTAPNGSVPANGNEGSTTPLAEFKDLWQPTPTDPNAPQGETPLTPQQMMEAASKVDFSRVLAPEDLKKIAAGGEEAQAAFASAMNKVAQAAYGQATVVNQKLIDRAVEKEREAFVASLPTLIKKHTLNDSAENPALRDPAISPVIAAIQSQLVEKYPKASTAELRAMATKIFTGAADMVAPKQKPAAANPEDEGIDWDKWISTPTAQ